MPPIAQTPTLAPEVANALRAWAGAESLEAGRKALRQAHRQLTAENRRTLELWTARMSFETLIEAMASMEGIGEERVEWQGAAFHPRQLERLASWVQDQIETAKALGVDRQRWSDAVLGAASWYREQAQQANRAGPNQDHIAAARKFLGG
jgi:hypothetical protein